jgi:hypothetical protein
MPQVSVSSHISGEQYAQGSKQNCLASSILGAILLVLVESLSYRLEA